MSQSADGSPPESIGPSITEQELSELFDLFNQHYFGGRLRKYQVRIVTQFSTERRPETGGHLYRKERLIEIRPISLFGDNRLPFEMAAILLHEMVHVAVSDYHGQKFKEEVRRLQRLAGIDEIDEGYDIWEGTEQFVMILEQSPWARRLFR